MSYFWNNLLVHWGTSWPLLTCGGGGWGCCGCSGGGGCSSCGAATAGGADADSSFLSVAIVGTEIVLY